MGVWIETIEKLIKRNSEASLLMWECGLKPNRYNEGGVASKSLLMWECGLKPSSAAELVLSGRSLLMWECGLKH